MSKNFSDHYFFIEAGTKTNIQIEEHEYIRKNRDEVNGKIIIEDSRFLCETSMPKEQLKELAAKINEFLKETRTNYNLKTSESAQDRRSQVK